MTPPIDMPHGALEAEARALDSHGLSHRPPRAIAALFP